MRNTDIEMNDKKKKVLRYTRCFKKYEKELTWDLFTQCLKEHMEFCFFYDNLTIDVAFHYEGSKKKYELNVNGGKKAIHWM